MNYLYPAVLLIFISGGGRTVPEYQPEIEVMLQFDKESIALYEAPDRFERCEEVRDNLATGGRDCSEATPAERKILSVCDDTKEDIWDIVGGGCSWYCGGGHSRVVASSHLAAQGSYGYEAGMAGDLSYATAWVEGVPGHGTGQSLTYYFAPGAPRVTDVIVVNGYAKSPEAYTNNSRVKKLKMSYNGRVYAYLNLKDINAEQRFTVDTLGYHEREDKTALSRLPEWTLSFEIMEVYPGAKYDDTAITEIYFNGIDVH